MVSGWRPTLGLDHLLVLHEQLLQVVFVDGNEPLHVLAAGVSLQLLMVDQHVEVKGRSVHPDLHGAGGNVAVPQKTKSKQNFEQITRTGI